MAFIIWLSVVALAINDDSTGAVQLSMAPITTEEEKPKRKVPHVRNTLRYFYIRALNFTWDPSQQYYSIIMVTVMRKKCRGIHFV